MRRPRMATRFEPIPETVELRGETSKAHAHRVRDGWYHKYVEYPGIDIGSGPDPLLSWLPPDQRFRAWDKQDGDAVYMNGVPDATYRTVYAAHVLEHLTNPELALRNWWRILGSGGHLIVLVPDRDLYERKKTLPSAWAPEHKSMWKWSYAEPPCTLSLRGILELALGFDAV